MKIAFLNRFKAASGLGLALLFGCSSSSDNTPVNDKTLELYSWWTNPGETDALQALLDNFQGKYPQTTVINATVKDPNNARVQLNTRMITGSPPDTFQALGGSDLLKWVVQGNSGDAQSKLEPVNSVAQALNLEANVPKEVLNVLSYRDKIYGIPIGVHRFNVLYFNKKLFADNGLNPPTTLEEFYQVAEAFKTKGIIPLALGCKDPWTLSQVALDGLFVSVAGAEFRASYLGGAEAPNDPRVGNVLTEVARVLKYTNTDRDSLTWDKAAQLLVDNRAAMTITADFAKGFFLSKGLRPDVDLGQLPVPGAKGVFVYVVDSFNLPRGAVDRQAAVNFLNVIGAPEAQNIFNPIKGSSPPRIDADLSRYDSLAQQTIADFRQDLLTTSSIVKISSDDFRVEFDNAMRQFSLDSNVDTVLNMLRNRYDLLK